MQQLKGINIFKQTFHQNLNSFENFCRQVFYLAQNYQRFHQISSN